MLLSTKDLVFKERPVRKLTERYMGPYVIEEVVLLNAVKLQLPTLMRIHLVVSVVERVYSRKGYMGKERKSEKYRGSLRRI